MRKTNTTIDFLLTTVLLMALWFVMSEKTELKFLVLGAISSMVISYTCVRILTVKGIKTDNSYFLLGVNPIKFIIYCIWLLWQIIVSAITVSRISFVSRKQIDPQIAWFKADYDNPAARALLANSITLTPGTITIDITEDGVYSAHALNSEMRDGLLDGSMQAKIAWLYGESIDYRPLDPDYDAVADNASGGKTVASKYKTRRS